MRYFKPHFAFDKPEPEHRLCGEALGLVSLQQTCDGQLDNRMRGEN